MAQFGHVITAMATPFDREERLDYKRATELARWLVDHGSERLVIAGTTGEAATLSDEEKVELFRTVKQAVGGRAKVIAGTGTYDTAHSIHLSKQAEKAGADGLLLVNPYYNRPSQDGLYAPFRKVAEYPSLPGLAVGGTGVISVASHLVGNEIGQMIRAFFAGDVRTALQIHMKLWPLFKVLFITTNPVPLKAALRLAGFDVGTPRLPLVQATPKEQEQIRAVLQELSLLPVAV